MKYIDELFKEIMEGNVVGDLQRSNFIRPATQTECNGSVQPEGALRKFDLDCFGRYYTVPSEIMNVININPDKSLVLYAFKKPTNSSVSFKVWAWVLTDEFHKPIAHCGMKGFKNVDLHLSMVLDWFNQGRLNKYVDTYVSNELNNFLAKLRDSGRNIKPSNFTVRNILKEPKPQTEFDAITTNTPSEAIETLREAILDRPELKSSIEIVGNITDSEWESLPDDYKHILFSSAPQARELRKQYHA